MVLLERPLEPSGSGGFSLCRASGGTGHLSRTTRDGDPLIRPRRVLQGQLRSCRGYPRRVAEVQVSCGDSKRSAKRGRGWTFRGVGRSTLETGRLRRALSTTVVSTTVGAAPAVAGPKVPGIDVSKYQGRIDWRAVATTPVRFAVLRATLGNRYRDGRYARNVAAARRNLVVGAYHYAKPGLARRDPRVEADHFLDVIGLRAGDIIPVLDIEETGGLGPRQLRTWASAWLEHVHERTGVRAMIYSGNSFWQGSMRNTASLARRDHPLWVAHWYVGAPDVPGRRWGTGLHDLAVVGGGRVAGIDGPVDRDWMKGSLSRGTVASITVRPAEKGVITGIAWPAVEGRDRAHAWSIRAIASRCTRSQQTAPGSSDGMAPVSRGEVSTCVVTALGDKIVSAGSGVRTRPRSRPREPFPRPRQLGRHRLPDRPHRRRRRTPVPRLRHPS